MNEFIQKIHHRLTEDLSPEKLQIIDESHLHAGHASAGPGIFHICVQIQSSKLNQLNRIQQHQLIYKSLTQWMPKPLHAVRMEIID